VSSLVSPGEAVGCLCAQGIGEPSTQMTLNTFHLAGHGGANVTLGIPRLREIIMTASAKLKTPIMEIPVKDHSEANARALASRLDRVTLGQYTDQVEIAQSLQVNGSLICRVFEIKLHFHPMDSYKIAKVGQLKFSDFVRVVDTQLIIKLNALISKEFKGRKRGEDDDSIVSVGKENKEMETDDTEVPLPGSEAAAKKAEKNKEKRKKTSYENLDDSDEEIMQAVDRQEQQQGEAGSGVNEGHKAKVKSNVSAEKSQMCQKDIQMRRHENLGKCEYISEIVFDEKSPSVTVTVKVPNSGKKLLMSSLIETAANNSMLRYTKGINGSHTISKKMTDGESKEWIVQTDGVSFSEMAQHTDLADMQRIQSNDIAAILVNYGVEAARKAIVNEISAVFAVYGIRIDYRHLSLLADYMTYQGGFKPLNRLAMASSVSPFQKISYETSMSFMLDACMLGDVDRLLNPSGRIVVGQSPSCGTGMFDLHTPLEYT